jgi:uncharacterized protein YjbI with pentapeptide repeats
VPPCRHFEVCGLDATHGNPVEFCILHLPDAAKPAGEFSHGLAAYLAAGRCDFRRFHFPNAFPADFSNREFTEPVDFLDALIPNPLVLVGSRLSRGLFLSAPQGLNVQLRGAVITGTCYVHLTGVQADLDSTGLNGPTYITAAAGALHVNAPRARFYEHVCLDAGAHDISSLNCSEARFDNGLTLRSRTVNNWLMSGAAFNGTIDCSGCEFTNLSFREARFDRASRLVLRNVRIRGNSSRFPVWSIAG